MSEEANNIKFVELVEKYPCLYDYKLPEYSRRDVIEKAWVEIAKQINCTVAAAKEKWKNLRSVYVRKRKAPPSGSGQKQVKPYYLSPYMEFITPFIKTQVAEHGNVPLLSPTHTNDTERELATDENAAKMSQSQIAEAEEPQSTVVKNVSREVSVQKKRKTLNEVDKTFIEYLESKQKKGNSSETADNPRRKFLESLLPEIDEMPEPTFRLFKRKIFLLIDNLNTNQNQSTSRQSDVSNSLPFSNPPSLTSTHASSPEPIQYPIDQSLSRPPHSSYSSAANYTSNSANEYEHNDDDSPNIIFGLQY